MNRDDTRSFKVIPSSIILLQGCFENEESVNEGRYLGKTPLQAAKKAFTQIARKLKKDECELIFAIKETTRNKDGKIYLYKASKEQLPFAKQIIKHKGDKQISYFIDHKSKITTYRP